MTHPRNYNHSTISWFPVEYYTYYLYNIYSYNIIIIIVGIRCTLMSCGQSYKLDGCRQKLNIIIYY